jgi:hypothetical protein
VEPQAGPQKLQLGLYRAVRLAGALAGPVICSAVLPRDRGAEAMPEMRAEGLPQRIEAILPRHFHEPVGDIGGP